jgi:uncharacterized protein (DUF1697 family)
MKTYLAFLRGINVSGQKKVSMAELREELSKSGLENIQTYIQSGNIIFKSSQQSIVNIELTIHAVIKNYFGFEVPVLVKTPKGLKQIFDSCPFQLEKKSNSYFMMLYSKPDRAMADEVSQITYPNEEFIVTDDCVYFYCAKGYGKAKCNNNFFERKLKVTSTARNYKTMVKLMSMLSLNEKGQ